MTKIYIFCLDIGGTRTKYGLVEPMNGRLVEMVVRPTVSLGLEEFTRDVKAALDVLCQKSGIVIGNILGAGIGVPGFVDGDLISMVWESIGFMNGDRFRRSIEDEIGLPVRMDNDARVVALGEAQYGRHPQSRRLLSLTLGTGLGIGFVVDGELQERSSINHMAGHILVRPEAPRCYCGINGCLESLVGGPILVENYKALRSARAGSVTAEAVEAKGVFERAQAGDELGIQIVDQWIADLCAGLNVYLYVYAPDLIVFGGGLSQSLRPYLPEIQSRLVAHPFEGYRTRLRVSRLGEKAGIYGAASLWKDSAERL